MRENIEEKIVGMEEDRKTEQLQNKVHFIAGGKEFWLYPQFHIEIS